MPKDLGTGVPRFRSDVGTRLREIERTHFQNRDAAAKAAGVSKSSFQRWVEGQSDPSFEGLVGLSKATGISLDWIATGEDSFSTERKLGVAEARRVLDVEEARNAALSDLRTTVAAIEKGDGNAAGPDKGFVMIPRYDVQASAGPGMFADQEQVIDYMAFQRGWVRRVLRANPDDLVLISAEGDSMEPAVRSGDLLLVDTAVTTFRDDAIYVVVLAGRLLVKRVQNFFDGAVTIKSDNAAYVEQTIGAGEVDQIQVAGRVRWIGRLI